MPKLSSGLAGGSKPLQDEYFSDDPFSNDSDMLQNDEEFNSSQVPEVTENYIQKLIDEIPKPNVQKPIQPGAGIPAKDGKSKGADIQIADSGFQNGKLNDINNDNNEETQGRFLCWNNTGIIRAQSGSDDQSVDVMFHDTEKHTSVNFKNEPNYTFGSMSDDAIVLGSNGKYGSGPATLHGINLLEPNPDRRDWELNLPYVELIEALAVGQGFVAIATDQRNLRLTTNGGMQSFTLTLPGQILCMSAYERQLMIIYHNGAGLTADQNLSMILYYIDLLNSRIEQVLPPTPVGLGNRSQLSWAGFSDEGTPCTYDYQGNLRMFRTDLGNSWILILNLKDLTSSALNHFYVVGLSEFTQKVRAVQCAGSRVPPLDTESPQLLDFSLPLCNMDTEKGQLEEEQVRLRLANLSYQRLGHNGNFNMTTKTREAKEKALVNTILRLFASYLREDKEELAKNLIHLMPKDHVGKLPEYAWKTKRRQHFIESLNELIEQREQQILSSLDNMSDFSMSKDVSTNGTYKM